MALATSIHAPRRSERLCVSTPRGPIRPTATLPRDTSHSAVACSLRLTASAPAGKSLRSIAAARVIAVARPIPGTPKARCNSPASFTGASRRAVPAGREVGVRRVTTIANCPFRAILLFDPRRGREPISLLRPMSLSCVMDATALIQINRG